MIDALASASAWAIARDLIVMRDFEIIDAHVHLWRTREQERAALPLPGRRDRDRWGTPEDAVRMMDRCGIRKLVFLNVLPTADMIAAGMRTLDPQPNEAGRQAAEQELHAEMRRRIRRQNQWACEIGRAQSRLVPFIGVQPLLGPTEAADEVRRGHAAGAKGIKIQPGMNGFAPNDHALWPAYEAAQELGLPVISDSGTYGKPSPDGRPYGQPSRFVDILETFPQLTFVFAHFASAYWDERVELAERYPMLHFDISGGFGAADLEVRDRRRALPEDDAVRIMRKVGIGRFLFGTDGPSVMPQPYIEQVLRLALDDDEKQLLLAENAKRVYGV